MGTQMENAIIQIHGWLGNTSGYYAIIMALWGLWRYFKKQGVDGEYWGALLLQEGLIILHGLMGIFLYFAGPKWEPPVQLAQPVHILFGAVSALVLPAAYVLTKRKKGRAQLLLYIIFNALLAFIIYRTIRVAGMMIYLS